MAKAAEGGAARLSGSEEGEGKRSDWDGDAKDGGRRRSKAKLPTADRSRASPGAESSRSPRSCSDPRPTKPEAAEAAPTEAESCRRSPKQPKPRRPKRKAAAEALLCPLPPKLLPLCIVSRGTFILHCFTWNILHCFTWNILHCFTWNIIVYYYKLFHVKHYRLLNNLQTHQSNSIFANNH